MSDVNHEDFSEANTVASEGTVGVEPAVNLETVEEATAEEAEAAATTFTLDEVKQAIDTGFETWINSHINGSAVAQSQGAYGHLRSVKPDLSEAIVRSLSNGE